MKKAKSDRFGWKDDDKIVVEKSKKATKTKKYEPVLKFKSHVQAH